MLEALTQWCIRKHDDLPEAARPDLLGVLSCHPQSELPWGVGDEKAGFLPARTPAVPPPAKDFLHDFGAQLQDLEFDGGSQHGTGRRGTLSKTPLARRLSRRKEARSFSSFGGNVGTWS